VVVQLLTEGTFTADRIQAQQQRSFQQAFEWNRRTTIIDIHPDEQRRELAQRFIGDGLDRPQGMLERDARLDIHEREHAYLRVLSSAHPHHLSLGWHHDNHPTQSTGRAAVTQNGRSSPAC
jgi:hypothetical protein